MFVMDWYDRRRDRGLSAFHAKHNFTFNGTWDLPFGRDAHPRRLRDNIANSTLNRSVGNSDATIEVIVATSGKALLAVRDRDLAVTLVERVTRRALEESPGLDYYGAVSEPFDWNTGRLPNIVNSLHDQFEELRSFRSDRRGRFLTLPVAAKCATSGWPASELMDAGGRPVVLSRPTLAKLAANDRKA